MVQLDGNCWFQQVDRRNCTYQRRSSRDRPAAAGIQPSWRSGDDKEAKEAPTGGLQGGPGRWRKMGAGARLVEEIPALNAASQRCRAPGPLGIGELLALRAGFMTYSLFGRSRPRGF